MALKFDVHVVQSFINGHIKSGVISIKHSRDITNRISTLTWNNVHFLPVTVTCTCAFMCVSISCIKYIVALQALGYLTLHT